MHIWVYVCMLTCTHILKHTHTHTHSKKLTWPDKHQRRWLLLSLSLMEKEGEEGKIQKRVNHRNLSADTPSAAVLIFKLIYLFHDSLLIHFPIITPGLIWELRGIITKWKIVMQIPIKILIVSILSFITWYKVSSSRTPPRFLRVDQNCYLALLSADSTFTWWDFDYMF